MVRCFLKSCFKFFYFIGKGIYYFLIWPWLVWKKYSLDMGEIIIAYPVLMGMEALIIGSAGIGLFLYVPGREEIGLFYFVVRLVQFSLAALYYTAKWRATFPTISKLPETSKEIGKDFEISNPWEEEIEIPKKEEFSHLSPWE